MDNVYIKEGEAIKDRSQEEKEAELLSNIFRVKKDLENANKNYDYAEGNLIDYYLYEIKANQSKLDHLIKQAKDNGMKVDLVKKLAINGKRVV